MSSNGKEWYAAMCRRPEWQKKRLKIMERDGWKCTRCGLQDKTLSVHHQYYKGRTLPWDYPDEALITLCADCHVLQKEAKLGERLLDAIVQHLAPNCTMRLLHALEHGLPLDDIRLVKRRRRRRVETSANDWANEL